jgi:hypothetical protein
MSTGRSGLSQNDQIALWTQFAKSTFQETQRRVIFNGKHRKVYSGKHPEVKIKIGRDDVFLVLDEYHGAMEVLTDKPIHLGSLQLVIEASTVRIGLFKPGCTHKYTWVKG